MRFSLCLLTCLLFLSCQKERKVCHVQQLEVSCKALEQQILLQERQKLEEAARQGSNQSSETQNTASPSDNHKATLQMKVAIESNKTSFEILENKEDKQVYTSDKVEYDCSLMVGTGDKARVILAKDLLQLTTQKKVMLFKRASGPRGTINGTWVRSVKVASGVSKMFIEILGKKEIQITKKCSGLK